MRLFKLITNHVLFAIGGTTSLPLPYIRDVVAHPDKAWIDMRLKGSTLDFIQQIYHILGLFT